MDTATIRRLSFAVVFLASIADGVLAGPERAMAKAGQSPPSQSVTGNQVVAYADRFLGYPYALTGSTPRTGFSCIGFVWYVYENLGIKMPGNLKAAHRAFPRVREGDLLPGDLIFFKGTHPGLYPSHVGIYIGQDKMISAENFTVGVKVSSLVNDSSEGSYWQHHYLVGERPLGYAGLSGSSATKEVPRSSGPMAVVSVSGLNLRNGHSIGSALIRVLFRGTPVNVIGRWGSWLKVAVGNGTAGWVIRKGVLLPGSESRKKSTRRREGQATVEINGLPLLNQPFGAARVLASLKYGERVTIIAHTRGWYEVRRGGGQVGWSVRPYLESNKTKSTSQKVHHNSVPRLTLRAHLRTGPSLSAAVVEWIPSGTRVVLLGRKNLWDHVRLPSRKVGYVWAQFVRR